LRLALRCQTMAGNTIDLVELDTWFSPGMRARHGVAAAKPYPAGVGVCRLGIQQRRRRQLTGHVAAMPFGGPDSRSCRVSCPSRWILLRQRCRWLQRSLAAWLWPSSGNRTLRCPLPADLFRQRQRLLKERHRLAQRLDGTGAKAVRRVGRHALGCDNGVSERCRIARGSATNVSRHPRRFPPAGAVLRSSALRCSVVARPRLLVLRRRCAIVRTRRSPTRHDHGQHPDPTATTV